jgi:hypothetical protein
MTGQQAAPGWYPVEGGQRWWDGAAWTEHFNADAADGLTDETTAPAETSSDASPQVASSPGFISARTSNIKGAAGRIRSDELDLPEDTVWSAVGKSMASITTGRYILTPEYLYFEKGTLKTAAQQVYTADIGNVEVKQSMTQKARGVYTLVVHVNGRMPVPMEDIQDGGSAQRIINETSYKARLIREHRAIHIDGLRHQATNTTRQEIAYDGTLPGFAPATPVPGLPPTGAIPALAPVQATGEAEIVDAVVIEQPTFDPIAQLKELGGLRDAGILTEDEFATKKAEILSRM